MALTTQQQASVLADLEQGITLRQACRNADIRTPTAVLRLCESDPDFAERYTRARADGYATMGEAIIDIADDLTIDPNSRRVMTDSRKWILSKMLPKVYGDRLDLQHSGSIKSNADALTDAELQAVVAARQPK